MIRQKRISRQTIVAYLCIAPALLGFFMLTLLPVLGVIVISFTRWTGLQPPSWVGFENYTSIFTKDLFFFKSVVVTLYFALGSVIGSILYSFFVAILLNRDIPGRSILRSIYYVPAIVPVMAVNIVWAWMYDANFGLFNFIINSLGMDKSLWIYGETTSVPSLVLMTVWGTGNLIVIFLAGLQNVPKAYLEAVEIDGGNAWHKFRNVTIPMMTPIIFFNFLMNIITNLQVFVPSLALTNGGPNDSTLFMVFLIYREGFIRNNMGYACSISFIFFIFIAILTALIFYSSNKWVYYEGK